MEERNRCLIRYTFTILSRCLRKLLAIFCSVFQENGLKKKNANEPRANALLDQLKSAHQHMSSHRPQNHRDTDKRRSPES